MGQFKVGQRWVSESEPELGLGILESVDRLQIRLVFPASNEARIYSATNAPIKRVEFRVGDSVSSHGGVSLVVEAVEAADGLLTYVGGGERIVEAELADTISFSKPEDRLINGQVDSGEAFALRVETLERRCAARRSPVAGFAGGRIDLIPHQLYIAAEVSKRYLPRVLLADEVGLGKTIEACMILHRMYLTGRAKRVLIVLPESLVHQWFVELYRKFNLLFALIDGAHCEAAFAEDGDVNPFLEEQLVICSLGTLLENEQWAAAATEAKWDLMVVDEAHHLGWSTEAVSREYALVEALAKKSAGLLLLTATPEQLGAEGHFARLRLLDPNRYPDLDLFKEEQASYAEIAKLAEKLGSREALSDAERVELRGFFEDLSDAEFEAALAQPEALLGDLVDRHGTGRVIFRNTRDALQGFPERQAKLVEVSPRKGLSEVELQARLLREFELELGDADVPEAFDFKRGPRIEWLADLLRELKDAKVLLICRSREKVQAIYDALLDTLSVKAAVFHEELTLIQRDRNAAWFAEPEGARVLICSEIGSEGRNFQFAHHLVLFDLPLNPELLEQRIGRLDRIGQTETIRVHVPYLKASAMEFLMRWHHEGLDGFERSLKGGDAYTERFGQRVLELGSVYHEQSESTLGGAEALIGETREYREDLESRLSAGQNKLIALNSFNADAADGLVESVRGLDRSAELDGFMSRIFDHYGVNVDELGRRLYRLSAGHLFTDSFPCLSDEGQTVTFERSVALSREDIDFLTWDHPMVRGAIDLMLGAEHGNSSMVVWKEQDAETPPLLIEAIFVLECVAPARLHVDRFLPPTPIRVLVDMGGEDLSARYGHAELNGLTRDEDAFRIQENPQLLQALVPQMLMAARDFARKEKSACLEVAIQTAHAKLDGEAVRLRDLAKVNANVSEGEIRVAEKVVLEVSQHLAKSHLRLDGVRLILRAP